MKHGEILQKIDLHRQLRSSDLCLISVCLQYLAVRKVVLLHHLPEGHSDATSADAMQTNMRECEFWESNRFSSIELITTQASVRDTSQDLKLDMAKMGIKGNFERNL